MNLRNKEHNPPHIHAIYGDYAATFFIKDGDIFEGEFPKRAKKLVKEFINKNKEELLTMWETENYKKLKGLE